MLPSRMILFARMSNGMKSTKTLIRSIDSAGRKPARAGAHSAGGEDQTTAENRGKFFSAPNRSGAGLAEVADLADAVKVRLEEQNRRSAQNALEQSRFLFRSELLRGERMLWAGKPLPRVLFGRPDWLAVPGSILLAVLSLVWEYRAAAGMAEHPSDRAAWFLPMLCAFSLLLLSQYLLWFRYFRAARQKQHTFYAVTNKRILVLTTGPRRRVTDGFIAGLDTIALQTGKNGAGTIEFSMSGGPQSSYTGVERRRSSRQDDINLGSLAFYDIAGAREVYRLIQQERERALLF